jgi:hypothetical protein
VGINYLHVVGVAINGTSFMSDAAWLGNCGIFSCLFPHPRLDRRERAARSLALNGHALSVPAGQAGSMLVLASEAVCTASTGDGPVWLCVSLHVYSPCAP